MTVLEKIELRSERSNMNLIVEKTRKNDVFEIRVTSHTSNDSWCVRISTHYRTANQHVAESTAGSKAYRHLM